MSKALVSPLEELLDDLRPVVLVAGVERMQLRDMQRQLQIFFREVPE
jgi:hypothetical protein